MKPLLIYDGDCDFCRRWVNHWQSLTKAKVDYQPFQKVSDQFPQIPQEKFEGSVQLIDAEGKIFSGAEAVFRTLAHVSQQRWLLFLYERFTGFRRFSEWFYRVVAKHRKLFSVLTRFFWGEHIGSQDFFLSSWLFLKLLGLVYLVAFCSLGSQISGLVGSKGILPASDFLNLLRHHMGPERYHVLPTLCWFNASDGFLQFLCWVGALLSGVLILGFAPAPILFLLWSFYLSLTLIGREFLSFQWDVLLLETGFLAIFLAPLGFLPKIHSSTPSRTILWLFRWLLFRLMFSSGVVKLSSGDPTWRTLTALNYHYETQPLPTWLGWYAHQLPHWFQKMSVAGMFAIELACPLLIFAPRRLRFFGAAAILFFQLLIAGTGNYCFFNMLAIFLCLFLFDDHMWPEKWRQKVLNKSTSHHPATMNWSKWITAPLAVMVIFLSIFEMPRTFRTRIDWPKPAVWVYKAFAPFCLVNSYGLFAVMTTSRPEIIVEGSYDRVHWLPYEFKYKPGDLKRKPDFVAPHQPRLDWQMWFAALGDYRENPWFINFCLRLLQGSPSVKSLLAKDPFSKAPPRYIRAVMYDYRFTDFNTRKREGTWWHRQLKGLYCPVLSLRPPSPDHEKILPN